ncbi:hypothetical protein V499_01123 [Pseudogymnoascus sp. VKM F-103]|nr:hypothetical protein V499_01123 [Pseudogymnoascus sp. VKM F-103]
MSRVNKQANNLRNNTGKFKSAYAAAKALGLRPNTVVACVNGGNTRQEACQKQQLLSKTQEQTLLKWIKELTASGYAPSHRILQEVADEVWSNKCRARDVELRRKG